MGVQPFAHTRSSRTLDATYGVITGGGRPLGQSPIGYLIDWRDSASPALLYDLLEAGANVRVANAPFTALTTSAARSNLVSERFVAPK